MPFAAYGFIAFPIGVVLSLIYAVTLATIFDWTSGYQIFVWVFWLVFSIYLFIAPHLKSGMRDPEWFMGILFFGSIVYAIAFADRSGDPNLLNVIKALSVMFGTGIVMSLPNLLVIGVSKLKASRGYRQWFSSGRGGNARWAGVSTYDKHKFSRGKNSIRLGATLVQDTLIKEFVGLRPDDDSHHVTLAATGAGKSVTAIWPTLTEYEGPMVVLDPKGEHANFAAHLRANSKMLDPFDRVENTAAYNRAGYNPLSDIDIQKDNARVIIEAVTNACVIDSKEKDPHFPDAAKTIIGGAIAHVLSQADETKRNLPAVADLFRGFDQESGLADPHSFDDVIADMTTNSAAGGLPIEAAALLMRAGDRERGAMMTTCFRSLKWVNDPPMRRHLMGQGFSLRDFITAKGTATLFVVLPFEYMEESSQIRWMRLIVSMITVLLFQQPRDPSDPKLIMVLDEFYKLGYMPTLEEGIVTARGSGAKWWILLQDIGQLKALYKANWETFLGSSNVQVFGVNDQATIDWVSKALGGASNARDGDHPLMRPDEVREFLGKESPTQIIIPSTGFPMRLERLAFKPIKSFRGW